MNRREFVKTAFLAAGAALLPVNAAAWAKEYVESNQRRPVQRILYQFALPKYGVRNGYNVFAMKQVEFESLHVGDCVLEVLDWGDYCESSWFKVVGPVTPCQPKGNSYCEVMPL